MAVSIYTTRRGRYARRLARREGASRSKARRSHVLIRRSRSTRPGGDYHGQTLRALFIPSDDPPYYDLREVHLHDCGCDVCSD